MRISCNGCRSLRKGCSDDCSIRPCLDWIKSEDSQANATVFLAKFYGRAGLLNLINGGPEHLRPAIFRSLLYEACGRLINPIYGSVGLLWSGKWQLCQEAVEAILRGDPISLVRGDIRHVCKELDLTKVKKRARIDPKIELFSEEVEGRGKGRKTERAVELQLMLGSSCSSS